MTEDKKTELTAVDKLLAKVKVTYEPVELPSKGLLYPKSWTDKKGRISVRRWTVEEEKILSTVQYVKSGKAVDMMLKNCLENSEINTGELLSGDRSFLLYHLRNISYGAAYEFKTTCHRCGAEFPVEANLNKIKVKSLEDKFEEPCTCTLPISKAVVEFNLMRGKDELALVSERSRKLSEYSQNQVDNTLTERYVRQIVSLDGITDKLVIRKFVDMMIAGDSSFLRKEMDKQACGVDFMFSAVCGSCGAEIGSEVPITTDFFRTAGQ